MYVHFYTAARENHDGDQGSIGVALQTAGPCHGTQLQGQLQLRSCWSSAERWVTYKARNELTYTVNEKLCLTELKERYTIFLFISTCDFTILGFRHPAQTTTSRTIRVLNQLLSITVKPTNR